VILQYVLKQYCRDTDRDAEKYWRNFASLLVISDQEPVIGRASRTLSQFNHTMYVTLGGGT
jgi:hypothetical protein